MRSMVEGAPALPLAAAGPLAYFPPPRFRRRREHGAAAIDRSRAGGEHRRGRVAADGARCGAGPASARRQSASPRTTPAGACRCLACRPRPGTWTRSALPRRGSGTAPRDVVFLGTGGSSLGGQTLAQLADYAVPGLGRFAEAPRVHFLDNLDPQTFGRLPRGAAARDLALRRDLEIRRHRRDPDAGDRRALRARQGRASRPRRRSLPRAVGAAPRGRPERPARPPRARGRAPSSTTTPASAGAIRS